MTGQLETSCSRSCDPFNSRDYNVAPYYTDLSTTAWNALVSLSVIALYFSYILPCLFIFICRFRGQEIPQSAWNLGRWGIWLNGYAVIWGLFVIVWLCFPVTLPVDAASLNWSGPIMGKFPAYDPILRHFVTIGSILGHDCLFANNVVGFVIILAMCDWFVRGRRKFQVPGEQKVLY